MVARTEWGVRKEVSHKGDVAGVLDELKDDLDAICSGMVPKCDLNSNVNPNPNPGPNPSRSPNLSLISP